MEDLETIGNIYEFNTKYFIMAYLLFLCLALMVIKFSKKANARFGQYNIFFIAIFVLYILLMIKILFFPLFVFYKSYLYNYWKEYGRFIKFIQFVPFESIKVYFLAGSWKAQILGNIFIFVPLPIFYGVFKNKDFNYKKCLFVGILTILLVEIIQLMINIITNYPNRLCDIDDLIINSIGIVIGTITYCIIDNNKHIKKIFNTIILKVG